MEDNLTILGVGITRTVMVGDRMLSPVRSQQVVNHSPDGFNWGYSGSGPAQLALAILLEAMPQEAAELYYHHFNAIVIKALPSDGFKIKVNMRKYIDRMANGQETVYSDIVETLIYVPSTFRVKMNKNNDI